jgi:hypothetical protein
MLERADSVARFRQKIGQAIALRASPRARHAPATLSSRRLQPSVRFDPGRRRTAFEPRGSD